MADYDKEVSVAHERGRRAAGKLKIGDEFVGAGGAACELGYYRDNPYRRRFVDGYLEVLHKRCGGPGRLICDNDGYIKSFGPPQTMKAIGAR